MSVETKTWEEQRFNEYMRRHGGKYKGSDEVYMWYLVTVREERKKITVDQELKQMFPGFQLSSILHDRLWTSGSGIGYRRRHCPASLSD